LKKHHYLLDILILSVIILAHPTNGLTLDVLFSAPINYSVGIWPGAVINGDFNDDGVLDLAVANDGSSNISILLGNGDGTFSSAINYSTGAGPRSITKDDFNSDGIIDLAVVNSNSESVSILLGNGDGTFASTVNYSVGVNPLSIVSADLDMIVIMI